MVRCAALGGTLILSVRANVLVRGVAAVDVAAARAFARRAALIPPRNSCAQTELQTLCGSRLASHRSVYLVRTHAEPHACTPQLYTPLNIQYFYTFLGPRLCNCIFIFICLRPRPNGHFVRVPMAGRACASAPLQRPVHVLRVKNLFRLIAYLASSNAICVQRKL